VPKLHILKNQLNQALADLKKQQDVKDHTYITLNIHNLSGKPTKMKMLFSLSFMTTLVKQSTHFLKRQ